MEAPDASLHQQVGCPCCQHVFRADLPQATIINDNTPAARIAPDTPEQGDGELDDLVRALGPARRRPVTYYNDGTEDALMKMSADSTHQPKREGWYVKTGKGDVGPLSDNKLIEVTGKGLIERDTILKRGKGGKYVAAGQIPGLFKAPPADADKPGENP